MRKTGKYRGQPVPNMARRAIIPSALLIILLCVTVIVGCAGSTATSTLSPAESPPIVPKNEQPPSATRTVYPLTVTDVVGRTLTLKQKPARIITIHPTATEMLYRVGGTAVGRDTGSRYPEDAAALPTVGSSYSPSTESVAALSPDLIILEALSQSQLLSVFEKLNVPVLVVRAASLNDIKQGLTIVGKVVDLSDSAAQAIVQIDTRIEAVKKNTRTGRSVLIIIGDANRNIYAAKPESYPGALLTILGQKNLAEGLADSGPYPGFASYTGEQALTSKPGAIFAISPAPPPAPKLSEMLPQVPGFNGLDVVKMGKVKELDPALFLQAQGPRIADAVEQLAGYLNEVAP